jgi:hypothetical protein
MFFDGGEHRVRDADEITEAVVNGFTSEGVAIWFTGYEAAPHCDRWDGVQSVIAIILSDRTPDAVILIPVFRGLPIDRGVVAAVEKGELRLDPAV